MALAGWVTGKGSAAQEWWETVALRLLWGQPRLWGLLRCFAVGWGWMVSAVAVLVIELAQVWRVAGKGSAAWRPWACWRAAGLALRLPWATGRGRWTRPRSGLRLLGERLRGLPQCSAWLGWHWVVSAAAVPVTEMAQARMLAGAGSAAQGRSLRKLMPLLWAAAEKDGLGL